MNDNPEKKGERHQMWQRARDRVLLYTRALNLPPFRGLDLAVESLKRSGATSTAESMRTLRALLTEEKLDRGTLDSEGQHIGSFPQMNRGFMVAEPLDRMPWITRFKNGVRRVFHIGKRKAGNIHD